jgi:hypothetical protein
MAGKSRVVNMNYTGVGDIEAYELIAQELTFNGSGIGDIFLYAVKSLIVESTGVGDIRYKGDPASQRLIIEGIGTIQPKEKENKATFQKQDYPPLKKQDLKSNKKNRKVKKFKGFKN